ncbi:MAG: polysaccharide pyruvyl transferase family protein [Candidatus Symbiothrix sp.]|jgi:polysaccharide pyruvyl transferase WcaK-like protein|nr:polysaccharide pyruvyl transferase family protein [Candidatus Symbiothrix sp.]
MNKRNLISIILSVSLLLSACGNGKEKLQHESKPLNILVVSGWQDINIGDIAHTPGLLHVLQTKFPGSKIVLWKLSESEQVEALLKKNFPAVEIVYGHTNKDYTIDSPEVNKAMVEADVFIHGSGPYVVASDCLEAWRKKTAKPFGVFGVTIDNISPGLKDLLQDASFVFTRETESIERLKKAGVTNPYILFVPDATFALNIRDDGKATAFMEENGLEERSFICVIPRLRKTPYWLIRPGQSEEEIKKWEDWNNRWKEVDHAKLREAIIRWVRTTSKRVLVCPEMTYQVDIMDELLIDPLPDDVKPFVTKRGYWLPDEAASLYSKAFCLLSFECHSPIIALCNGTPAIYLRQPDDTIKGQMYYDLGYDQWVFEIEHTTGSQIADRLMEIYAGYDTAQIYRKNGIDKAWNLYEQGAEYIKSILN